MSRLVTIDGQKVRKLRTEAEFTQEELADRSGISARYISKIENGHVTEVETETRAALAEALAGDDPQIEITDAGRAALAIVHRRRSHGRIVTTVGE